VTAFFQHPSTSLLSRVSPSVFLSFLSTNHDRRVIDPTYSPFNHQHEPTAPKFSPPFRPLIFPAFQSASRNMTETSAHALGTLLLILLVNLNTPNTIFPSSFGQSISLLLFESLPSLFLSLRQCLFLLYFPP